MSSEKVKQIKTRLHPRNKNRERYDLNALLETNLALKEYVKPNKYGNDSVDFSNPKAVKMLNQALLHHYYGIKSWEFSDENLCPPIPGRADYLHYVADLLSEFNFGKIPVGDKISCLDIGVGASCIYPIIGITEYGWRFVGCDIDSKSLESAEKITTSNPSLQGKVDFRTQENPHDILNGILTKEEKIDLIICNPPFHSSAEYAKKGSQQKIKNLSGKKEIKPTLNFSGIHQELIYEGGEYQFIQNMIKDSLQFSKNCFWFTSLVSKQSHLKGITNALKNIGAKKIRTIPMGTGNKVSRIIAWTFLSKEEQKAWRETKW